MTSKGSPKILYIVQHRFNRSPGQRYRCEQYIRYLEENDFACTYSPLIVSREDDYALYNSRSLFKKAWIFIKGFFRRIADVIRARNYDIIFIYREAFMTGSIFFEKGLKKSGAKIVYDFDDAIWLPTISEANKSLQWLKRPDKINEIIALSNVVIAGNNYLAEYASTFNKNVVIFPSTIDLDYYQQTDLSGQNGENDKIIIGWSGSHTTIEHFEIIIPVLKRLKARYGEKIQVLIYGDPHYENQELGIKGIAWSHDTEIKVISSFSIGIMPLPDNEWSKGKCSMKALQYMGLSIPAVASAVGMNKEVIIDGKNGFLPGNNNDEWFEKLSLLIDNKEMRTNMGNEGRKTVEKHFSCQARKEEYVKIFKELSKEPKEEVAFPGKILHI